MKASSVLDVPHRIAFCIQQCTGLRDVLTEGVAGVWRSGPTQGAHPGHPSGRSSAH